MKSNKNSIILLFSLIMFNVAPVMLKAADDYPYPNSSKCHKDSASGQIIGCEVDDWNFYKRQCTSYAAWKADGILGNFTNTMTGPNGQTGTFGNAETWNDTASTIGYTTSTTPVVGAIAVWEANQGGAGDVGHVARVDSVNSDGTANISEYNWNASATNFWMGDGNYNTRNNRSAGSYISFNGNSCGGVNVVKQDSTITSSLSCSASNSITILPDSHMTPSGSNVVRFYIQ